MNVRGKGLVALMPAAGSLVAGIIRAEAVDIDDAGGVLIRGNRVILDGCFSCIDLRFEFDDRDSQVVATGGSSIRAERDITIVADNNLDLISVVLKAGRDVNIQAKGCLDIKECPIEAGGSVTVTAATVDMGKK